MTPHPTPAVPAGGAVRAGRDRPIIFSAPMVRALLDGRKTQTRRVLKPQPQKSVIRYGWDGEGGASWTDQEWNSHPLRFWAGDRLWVRENHAFVPRTAYRFSEGVEQIQSPEDPDQAAIYAAGWERSKPRWRPSIHMPRWASRLTLLVTDVCVERLNDISEADAIAEGASQYASSTKLVQAFDPDRKGSYREGFRELWGTIHGSDAWAANPWVVAVTFTVHRANIDALEIAARAA